MARHGTKKGSYLLFCLSSSFKRFIPKSQVYTCYSRVRYHTNPHQFPMIFDPNHFNRGASQILCQSFFSLTIQNFAFQALYFRPENCHNLIGPVHEKTAGPSNIKEIENRPWQMHHQAGIENGDHLCVDGVFVPLPCLPRTWRVLSVVIGLPPNFLPSPLSLIYAGFEHR